MITLLDTGKMRALLMWDIDLPHVRLPGSTMTNLDALREYASKIEGCEILIADTNTWRDIPGKGTGHSSFESLTREYLPLIHPVRAYCTHYSGHENDPWRDAAGIADYSKPGDSGFGWTDIRLQEEIDKYCIGIGKPGWIQVARQGMILPM